MRNLYLAIGTESVEASWQFKDENPVPHQLIVEELPYSVNGGERKSGG